MICRSAAAFGLRTMSPIVIDEGMRGQRTILHTAEKTGRAISSPGPEVTPTAGSGGGT
jgi:hypothetical protein